jgi:hypothetical protein
LKNLFFEILRDEAVRDDFVERLRAFGRTLP